MHGIEYQTLAKRTMPIDPQIVNGALGLAGEAGECADIIKKSMFQGHPFNKEHFVEELGDVLWYIALCCECLDTTLDEVMQQNVDKLIARYPEGFSVGASVDRTV